MLLWISYLEILKKKKMKKMDAVKMQRAQSWSQLDQLQDSDRWKRPVLVNELIIISGISTTPYRTRSIEIKTKPYQTKIII